MPPRTTADLDLRRQGEVLRQVTTTIRPIARLQAPPVHRDGTGIVVLGTELDTGQARALWARLGLELAGAEQDSRPQAWAWLLAWADRLFAGAAPVTWREIGARRVYSDGLAVRTRRSRAVVRIGTYQIAHVKRRASGVWSGPIAEYFPGTAGLSADCPDAMLYFTGRRLTVSGVIDALPVPSDD